MRAFAEDVPSFTPGKDAEGRLERTSRRVFGPDHPIAKRSKEMLQIARGGLAELFDG